MSGGCFCSLRPARTLIGGACGASSTDTLKAEKLLSLGNYPDVSLKRAREKRDEARRLLADGIDPSVQRKNDQQAKTETFEAIAREWLEMRAKTTAAITMQKARWLLEMVFPRIGKRPIREVTRAGVVFCTAED